MSVRAYRQLEPPKLADSPSFNLWHETEVLDSLLELESTWSTDECEQIEIKVDELDELLKTAKFDTDTLEALEEDVLVARKQKSEYITYYCF